MVFPGLSRSSVPLLGAGQPAASVGPPPDSFRRVPETDPQGNGRGRGVAVRVLITAAGTPHFQAPRRSASSGAATTLVGFVRRQPKMLPGPSRRRRRIQVDSPHCRAPGPAGLEAGRVLHRRVQSGHKGHHHAARRARPLERGQEQLRPRRRDVAGYVAVRSRSRRRSGGPWNGSDEPSTALAPPSTGMTAPET
jgi:hypothetical protein